MDDIEDGDFLLYLLLGAAVVYFLYKNNIFGSPAAAPMITGGGGAATGAAYLPSPSLPIPSQGPGLPTPPTVNPPAATAIAPNVEDVTIADAFETFGGLDNW